MSGTGPQGGSRRLRKFNPGVLQSDAELVRQFVVRGHELGIVRDVLQSNVDAPACQHVLVVAPRGRGKTMLLARVAAEIRTDAGLAAHLLPVRFMEESHEVFSLADFWLETLFHLASEIADREPDIAGELSATHAALASRWRDEDLEGMARAAVLDAADRLHRRFVVMVENLQSLVGSVDEAFGWSLRRVLQSVPQIMLVASATSRFEGLEDPGAPFFELFRLVHLGPLDTDGCRRLWEAAGGRATEDHEIRPLEILTGGSPRLIVVVAAFAHHRSLSELMEELVRLVDEHTEYFRGHLEALPRSERRVFVSLIDLWQPSTTGEIAARARLDVRVASTMLGRLVARGAVTAVPGPGGARLYAASERLYSIYYKLRRERDEAAVVEALIHFMVAFYDVVELHEVSDGLLRDAIASASIQAGMDRALAARIPVDDARGRVKWRTIERTSRTVRDRRRADASIRLQDEVNTAYGAEDWQRALDAVARFIADGWADAASPEVRDAQLAHLWHVQAEAHFCLGHFSDAVAIGNEAAERLAGHHEVTVIYRSCAIALVKAAAHYELGDFDAARSHSRDIVDRFGRYAYDVQIAAALHLQARAEHRLGEGVRAAALIDELLDRFGGGDDSYVQRSVVAALLTAAQVARGLGDWPQVIRRYGDAIDRFGETHDASVRESVEAAWLNRAFAFAVLGDFANEIACYDGVVRWLADADEGQKPSALVARLYKGRRLSELGRTADALVAVDDAARHVHASALPLPPATRTWMDWHLMGSRALAHAAAGAEAAAMDSLRKAYDHFLPGHEIAMREMLRLVPELVAAGAPERGLIEVLADDADKARALVPLVTALRLRTGETVRAPEEVLEVAADLRDRIEERLEGDLPPGFWRGKDGA